MYNIQDKERRYWLALDNNQGAIITSSFDLPVDYPSGKTDR